MHTESGQASDKPLKVAIIGSGISGLSAAWLLGHYRSAFSVSVFEKNDYAGGHSHTVQVPPLPEFSKKVDTCPVDTGFIVFNPATYPNFLSFLNELKVPICDSDMSFSVSRRHGEFEWAGDNLSSLFAQKKNLVDFSENGVWRMLYDVIRFHHQANDIVKKLDQSLCQSGNNENNNVDPDDIYEKYANMTIVEFLKTYSYSKSFLENFLVPQTACIWSTPADTCLSEFPIISLLRFFRNHRMLQLIGRPNWLTVSNGSKTYADAVLATLPENTVLTSTPVISVTRTGKLCDPSKPFKRSQVSIVCEKEGKKKSEKFDYVIFACHGDQSLDLLTDATQLEKEVLSNVKYTKNRAVLHRDANLMPKSRKAWSSWNYHTVSSPNEGEQDPVSLTYWMNRLQPFIPQKTHGDVFVSVNPLWEPAADTIIAEYEYEHPVYNFDLVQAQEAMNSIQGKKYASYAGAWCGYGFHEDGLTAGLLACLPLGATPNFPILLNGGYPTARTFPHVIKNLPYTCLPSDTIFENNLRVSSKITNLSMNEKHKTLLKSFMLRLLGTCHLSPDSIPTAKFLHRFLPLENDSDSYVASLHPSLPFFKTNSHLVFEYLERKLLMVLIMLVGVPILGLLWMLGKVEVGKSPTQVISKDEKVMPDRKENAKQSSFGKSIMVFFEDCDVKWKEE